uniref:Uncharacterized protein n=1 Tax=Opuntia streptacantha TaxID=393608 RepID=A0A7C9CUB8_OPUST
MLRFQVYILDYYCAVVFKDLSYLSNLTFLTSRYYFDCISNLDMHFMKHWQTVWFAVLPFPVLELHDNKTWPLVCCSDLNSGWRRKEAVAKERVRGERKGSEGALKSSHGCHFQLLELVCLSVFLCVSLKSEDDVVDKSTSTSTSTPLCLLCLH